MPVPYSDNLYSALDDEGDDDDAGTELSPTDGYFHASSSSSPGRGDDDAAQPAHLNVPVVPNVLVEDPTLREQDPGAKAREAAEEERRSSRLDTSALPSRSHHHSSLLPHHHRHRRSVEEQFDTGHAAEEQFGAPTPVTGHHAFPASLSSRHTQSQSPLFHHQGEAPPAYSPSSPTSPHGSGGGYQTFGPGIRAGDTMGHSAEERASLLHRDPESMGGAPAARGRQGWWARLRESCWRRRPWAPGGVRRAVKGLLGFLVVLAVVLAVVGVVETREKEEDDTGPSIPSDGKRPANDDLRWKPLEQCYNKAFLYVSYGTRFEFDAAQKLYVVEKFFEGADDGVDTWTPHVSGEVIFRPVSPDHSGEVDIEVLTNRKDLSITADADRDSGRIELLTPRHVKRDDDALPPCIQVRITVFVPGQASIASADVSLTNLDLEIRRGVALNVAGQTRLATVKGNVTTPGIDDAGSAPYTLSSREIFVRTTSGAIRGSWPLYDGLRVESVSGHISIDVEPKPLDPAHPRSAELSVTSLSGNIRASEPIDAALASGSGSGSSSGTPPRQFPPRDYTASVTTNSGDVEARLAFTSHARFYSVSGDLDVALWPLLFEAQKPTIIGPEVVTDTKSGKTTLRLHEPRWSLLGSATRLPAYPVSSPEHDVDGDVAETEGEGEGEGEFGIRGGRPLTLHSTHSSISGDVHLAYPLAWEGHLWAQTVSGSQRFRGDGLEVTRSGGRPLRVVEAHKGVGGRSDLRVESISGSQNFVLGNTP